MMGLRPEIDQASTSFYSPAANRKTYRFAERYSGRFFVSGVSGSFAKYTKQLKETDQKYLKQPKKYTHEPLLEKHQKEELRRDAQRLLEMEEQLAQLQRIRELKRQRDRARRKKKLEYMSALCIQRAFRIHIKYRKDKAADLLVSFLRTIAAQQSLSAAAWACCVMRRFAVKSSYQWKEKQLVRRVAHKVAVENWDLVREVASVWTVARRRATDELVFTAMRTGTESVIKSMVESNALLQPKKGNRKGRRHTHHKQRVKKGGGGDNAQFFLTEFDNPDEDNEDEYGYEYGSSVGTHSDSASGNDYNDGDEDSGSDFDENNPSKPRRYKRPDGRPHNSIEDLTASALAALRLSKRRRPVKTYDPSNTEHRRIIELHKKRLNDFAEEKARRFALMEQKREQEQKGLLERQASAELLKQTAEQQKKEFQEKLILEERAKARLMAKVRADREAARLKREAQEKREEQERNAMKQHDKPSYQYAGDSKKKNLSRPVSAVKAFNANLGAESRDLATDGTSEKNVPVRVPIKIKPPVVVDQAAVDHEYYQKSLPPKRPGVPRMAVTVDNAVKKKKADEMAAIEAEAIRQMEMRRAKYTSEEAVKRSRLAIQKRVQAKKEREALKIKEAEDAELMKKEKIQQIAELAAQRLKADLDKKKRKEAERRRELGIDTPPDPFSGPTNLGIAARLRRKLKNARKAAGGVIVSDSDATTSETESMRMKGAATRYSTVAAEDDPDGEGVEGEDERQNEEHSDADEGEPAEDGEEAYGKGSDSDSLDAIMAGLSNTLRNQTGESSIAPQKNRPQHQNHLQNKSLSSSDQQLLGTRSNSAGANDPSSQPSLNRNTASGGTDPRKPIHTTLYTPTHRNAGVDECESDTRDEVGGTRRETVRTAFERADISSAHEDFEDLMEDFGAADFLNQSTVTQLLRTNTAGELVEGFGPLVPSDFSEEELGQNRSHRQRKKRKDGLVKEIKPKLQTGATVKKIVIPKNLQNTPYFEHFKKHGGITESQSADVITSEAINDTADATTTLAHKGANIALKVASMVRTKNMLTGKGSGHGVVSAPHIPAESDELMMKQSMKPGKVASLLEMVSKARNKLSKHSGSGLTAAEASDTDTDIEKGKSENALSNPDCGSSNKVTLQHAAHVPVKFKATNDAQLDEMVPDLQPPTVPAPLTLPSMSFSSRKMQANIPLPPLSKDNLAILLKGKNTDSFAMAAGFPAGAGGMSANAVPKKISKKKGSEVTKDETKENWKQKAQDQDKYTSKSTKPAKVSKHSKTKIAPNEVAYLSGTAPSKTAKVKVNYAELSENIARNKGLANKRYASVGNEDDYEGRSDPDSDEDPQTNSPDLSNTNYIRQQKDSRGSKVRFLPVNENDDQEDDEDDDEGERLEMEYAALREQFNAKLQQAAAINQVVRSSQASTKELDQQQGGGEEEEDEEEEEDGEQGEASGQVTRSYSEGQQKISTQDLLRIWEMEDAAEEELRKAEERRQLGLKANLSKDTRYSTTNSGSAREFLPGNDDFLRIGGAAVRKNGASAAASVSTQLARRLYEEVEEERDTRHGARLIRNSSAKNGDRGSSSGSAPIPIPQSTVPADDSALDEECLSFMNKLSTKIHSKE